jgi:hypothetical protein
MMLIAGQVAKPPEVAAAILIFGVGLGLVAAVTLMAAVFERNVVAKRSQLFTYWALGIACVSALLVVIGTIETLDINSTPVKITGVASLVLVLLAIGIAFHAPSVPRGAAKCDKTCCQPSPKTEGHHDSPAAQAAQAVHEVPEISQHDKYE